MTDTYYVLKSAVEFQFKEKGSHFLAYAFPVETEEEAKQKLAELRKKYYNATHHCYAYTVGYPKAIIRQSDDGEPSGTAGLPIQNLIRARGIQNVLIAVVRYYGGIKLGTSGLIQAYKAAAAGVLNQAILQAKYLKKKVLVKVPFENLNEVMKIAKKHKQQPDWQTFLEDNYGKQQLTFQVRHSELPAFEISLRNLPYVEVDIETI
ncbi:MAG: YigZ family protein [Cytophagales bacterium]|nr:YigZ family protein [Bernardetiaceae bacterium]MDW8203734.1 YigZ family protein [Cytophagales bacterium]